MGNRNNLQPKMLSMKTYSIAILLGLIAVLISCNESSDGMQYNSSGKGGSMARFAITDTHVYTVDAMNLRVYEIAENGSIEKVNELTLSGNVETIFALGNKLYFGTSTSMLTYDITNPAAPRFDSQYSHFTACDPVVVQDTIAYVTIRSSSCRFDSRNILEILNVKDPTYPIVLSSIGLVSPYGLGVDGKTLFVCEGDQGITVIDVSDPRNPKVKKSVKDGNTYDLIPDQGLLIVTGKDGIMQYSYSEFELELLSKIGVEK